MPDTLIALGGAFLAAGLFGRLGRRVGLPTIPFFMAAGIVTGPHTPGLVLVHDPNELEVFATVGGCAFSFVPHGVLESRQLSSGPSPHRRREAGMKDLTILLGTTPEGVLTILSGLTEAGVEVQAGCLFSRTEGPVLHLAVEDEVAERARDVVVGAGAGPVDERDVVVVPLRDQQVVDVLDIMRRLAAAGVMPSTAYLAAGGRLVLGAGDLPAARAALEGV